MSRGNIQLTEKQREFLHNANFRYNFKIGGTGGGKTFLDFYNIIRRVDDTNGDGLIVILGNTKTTLQRNLIEPMQAIWGPRMVTNISSNNTLKISGKTVHALGASNSRSVARIQGPTIEYLYGDEMGTWSEEVFPMITTRLRTANSKMDGTANPEHPNHWLKKFIDEQEKAGLLYHQHYTIDDGRLSNDPIVDRRLKEEIKASLSGVFYDRLILGKWARADGLIYEEYAKDPEAYLVSQLEIPQLREIIIGMDFGGNKSKHAMVATGFTNGYKDMYVLASRRIEPNLSPDELAEEYVRFLLEVEYKYKMRVNYTYADSAEQMVNRSMRIALQNNGLQRQVVNSIKGKVIDRVRLELTLFNQRRIWFTKDTETLQAAFLDATWNSKSEAQERLDDGSSDIDSLDAFEYSFTPRMNYLVNAGRI